MYIDVLAKWCEADEFEQKAGLVSI
jgi:hypothetical protein